MKITLMKAKIHRGVITGAELDYEGSISIDKSLLEAAGLFPYEKVQVVNLNNGQRFETYVIEADAGSGEICFILKSLSRKAHRIPATRLLQPNRH